MQTDQSVWTRNTNVRLRRFKRSGINHANHIIQMISNIYSMLPWSQSEEDGPNLRSISLKGRAAHCLWETSLLALHFTDEICKWCICLISKDTSLHLSFLGQLTVHSRADGGAHRGELRRIVTGINICACHQKQKGSDEYSYVGEFWQAAAIV